MPLPESTDRAAVRRSLVVGAVVALVTLVGGFVLAFATPARWTAESSVVVLPRATLSAGDSASYYETLSRGQIVATFAEVAGNPQIREQAEDRLGLDDPARDDVSVEVSVVPNTAVVLIRATAGSPALAEQLADTTRTVSADVLSGLSEPFRAETVHLAAGTGYRSSTAPWVLATAAAVVALVGGLAVQQALYHTVRAWRSGRPGADRSAEVSSLDGHRRRPGSREAEASDPRWSWGE